MPAEMETLRLQCRAAHCTLRSFQISVTHDPREGVWSQGKAEGWLSGGNSCQAGTGRRPCKSRLRDSPRAVGTMKQLPLEPQARGAAIRAAPPPRRATAGGCPRAAHISTGLGKLGNT